MKNTAICVALLGVVSAWTGCHSGSSTTPLGNWVKRSDFDGVGRSDAASFVINDKAYVGTGFDGLNRLKDFWEYDPDQNAWIQKADFPGTARNGAVGFSAGGNGYIATGYDGVNYLKDNWEYNPSANTWTQKSDFGGAARYGAVAFSFPTEGYITTGYSGNYEKDFWQYDPANDQWTQKVSMGGSKRRYAMSFVMNNVAYIVGGENNGSLVPDFWEYDPTAGQWIQKRDIANTSSDSYDDAYATIERQHGVAFVIGDSAYLATGQSTSLLGNVWQYDPKTDLWVERTALEGSVRLGAIGFSVKGRGFIALGSAGGTTQYDDLREFQPYIEDNTSDDN